MNAGTTYEQSVVEFFKEPHTTGQLNKWLKRTDKLSQITNCYKTYIRPLLARGLIMQLYPFTENKGHMKYVAVGYDKTPLATEDAILEFCREPRTKRDIRIHFCLSHWQSTEYVRRLLADNKMISDDDKPFSRPTKTFRAIVKS